MAPGSAAHGSLQQGHWSALLWPPGHLPDPGGAVAKICLPMPDMRVPSLGQEGPPEKEMAAHSSILAWEIPWMEETGGLEPMGSRGVRYD